MRRALVAGRALDVHGSAYTPLLHSQAFGRPLSADLDAAAAGDAPALGRAAWSMAATAARACGRPAPPLSAAAVDRADGALVAALLAEAARGCFVPPGPGPAVPGQRGGPRGVDEAVLAVCLARGMDPSALAAVSTGTLLAALDGGRGATTGGGGPREATPADIMRLLG